MLKLYSDFFLPTLYEQIKLVRTVDSQSEVKTFFGSGKRGSTLDSSDPHKCELNSPQGVTYDRANEIVYIADTGNHRVLRLFLPLPSILTCSFLIQ